MSSSLAGCTLADCPWWAGRTLFGRPAGRHGPPLAGGHSRHVKTPSAAAGAGGSVLACTRKACWLPWMHPYTPDGGELGMVERWLSCGGSSDSLRL